MVRTHEAQDQRMLDFIQNIHVLPQPTIRISLEDQFNLLQERATKSFPYAF